MLEEEDKLIELTIAEIISRERSEAKERCIFDRALLHFKVSSHYNRNLIIIFSVLVWRDSNV